MVTRSLPAGIGAIGSTKARFFHPSDKIRAKWPNDNKRQLVNVLVIGEGQRFVNKKNQWCYPVKSILFGLLVVMLFQTLVSWETTLRISGAKESKSTTTTNQRPKMPNLPWSVQTMGSSKSP